MTKKELLKYEQRLLEEKTRILHQRGFMGAMLVRPEQEAAGDTANNPGDLADQGYDTSQRELASRMTSEQSKTLMEIDEALRRIELKTYGICEICGKRIPKARLDIVPYTRYDMKCIRKREAERFAPPPAREKRIRRRRKRRA
jgi:RNA polymerase-binding transcription factor DksA